MKCELLNHNTFSTTSQDSEHMATSKEDILSGFQINWITIKDLDTGEIVWHSNEDYSDDSKVFEVKFPKRIFNSSEVVREINFSSAESLEKLSIVHSVYYKHVLMEELNFELGRVQAGSTNTWRSFIKAAPEAKLMTPRILSGNLLIVTKFLCGGTLITSSKIQVFYV